MHGRKDRCSLFMMLMVCACTVLFIHGVADAVTIQEGDIIVADSVTKAIIKIDPLTGDQEIISSGGQFHLPRGVTMDEYGQLYVGDYGTGGWGRLYRVDPGTGTQTLITNNIQSLYHLAMDDDGTILATAPYPSTSSPAIKRISPDGSHTSITYRGELDSPHGIAIEADGGILVADMRYNYVNLQEGVMRVDPATGTQTMLVEGGYFIDPTDVLIESPGIVLVADMLGQAIYRVNIETATQQIVSSGGFFVELNDLAYEQDGMIIASDSRGKSILRVNPITGEQTVVSSEGYLGGPHQVMVVLSQPVRHYWQAISEPEVVKSLALSPSWAIDQTIMFGSVDGRFYRSVSGGTSWWSTQLPGAASISLDTIALSPEFDYGNVDQTVLLGGTNNAGVFLSQDSGVTWSQDTTPGRTYDLACSPDFDNDSTVFVAGEYKVHQSTDGGLTFTASDAGLPGDVHMAIAISSDYPNDQTVFAGSQSGVYKSIDGGLSWTASSSGLEPGVGSLSPVVVDLAVSPNYADDQTVFACVDGAGIYRSIDGGANWQQVNDTAHAFCLQSLAISPNYDRDVTLFASYQTEGGDWNGVTISEDKGLTWSPVTNAGLSAQAQTDVYRVRLSPNFAFDNRIYIGTCGGVYTGRLDRNIQPLADAGSDQAVYIGDMVTLDGSFSFDPDGDPLSFNWSIVSKPAASSAMLAGDQTVNPTFYADTHGTYVVELVVNDGTVDSEPDTVQIGTINVPPIADAGEDQTVYVSDTVVLDGSLSHDPDGDTLTYNWSLTAVPNGSSAVLDDPYAVDPTFVADVPGTYTVSLTVNDGIDDSEPDTLQVSTYNVAPIADAGDDQAIYVGLQVTLDGSGSWDPDGDTLTYQWAFTTLPEGSGTVLDDPSAVTTTFTADLPGTYIVRLVVNDGEALSDPDTVELSTVNVAPVADAGVDQSVFVGEQVILDGSNSHDPDGDPISYSWAFVSLPEGSSAAMDDPMSVSPVFSADLPGNYTLNLVVYDGTTGSEPDTVTVSAIEQVDDSVLLVQEAIEIVNDLDRSVFKNRHQKKRMTRMLNNIARKLEHDRKWSSLIRLKHWILRRIDGCALTGEPHRRDWITDCNAQAELYPVIIEAIELLEEDLGL